MATHGFLLPIYKENTNLINEISFKYHEEFISVVLYRTLGIIALDDSLFTMTVILIND